MKYGMETIENSGNGIYSEDRLLLSDKILGVIDGATPVRKVPIGGSFTQAEWMVDSFAKKFPCRIEAGQEDYGKIARRIVDELSGREELQRIESSEKPSFTSATVTLHEKNLFCQVIGDSCIYVRKKTGEVIQITDRRVDAFSAKTAEAVKRARAEGLDEKEAAKKQKLENGRMRNTLGGYWVIAFDGAFEKEFEERTFITEEVDRVLLCTDGLERLFREFALRTPEEFFDSWLSLKQALAELRKYESEQFSRPYFPCVKQSDDVAAVLIEFTESNREPQLMGEFI